MSLVGNLPQIVYNESRMAAEPKAQPLILIVEDDPALSKMYAIKFQNSGFQVIVAHDGATGLSMAAQQHPDIVLLDMMLPKYSGIEFLEQLQQHSQQITIPIIALSNKTDQQDVDRAKKLGVREYLAKAMYTPEQVMQTVNKYLGDKAPQPVAQEPTVQAQQPNPSAPQQ